MRLFIAIAAASLASLGAAPYSSPKPGEGGQEPAPAAAAKVVVHEWGTFTSVAGADGASLDWRPLAGPSDLPSFVYDIGGSPKGLRHGQAVEPCPNVNHEGCKLCTEGTIRMETPVLYFYSDRETTISVKVDFPKGRITEWYPSARNVGRAVDWGQVRILPKANVSFPSENGKSHYYPARETDADPVRVCVAKTPEHEKFLFYRGVGTFELPLKVTLNGNKVTVRNLGKDQIDQVILFDNRNGKLGYRIHCYLNDEVTLDLPNADHGMDSLLPDLEKVLKGQGLYEKEAKAMIKTWRDSWFEPGLRVFYTVPRAVTDRVLPIELKPAPSSLVRTLVGRAEIITPELEATLTSLAADLGAETFEKRDAASKALLAYGRFAEPVLRKILEKTTDAEVKVRIRQLIGG
jgi:hypothetical protein